MNKKRSATNRSLGWHVSVGTAGCIAMMLLGVGISAGLISSELIAEEMAGICAMVILLLSSLLGTGIGVCRADQEKFVLGAIIQAIYYLCLLALNILLFEGRFAGMIVTGLMIICGGALSIFLCTKDKKRSISRKSKIKRRQFVQNTHGR